MYEETNRLHTFCETFFFRAPTLAKLELTFCTVSLTHTYNLERRVGIIIRLCTVFCCSHFLHVSRVIRTPEKRNEPLLTVTTYISCDGDGTHDDVSLLIAHQEDEIQKPMKKR